MEKDHTLSDIKNKTKHGSRELFSCCLKKKDLEKHGGPVTKVKYQRARLTEVVVVVVGVCVTKTFKM